MYAWIAGYIVFVMIFIGVIYFTVNTTYLALHKNEDIYEEFSNNTKCIVDSSDNVPHPWDDNQLWMQACPSHNPDDVVACVEVSVNMGSVEDSEDIPPSNSQRIYMPVGTTNNLREDVKYDVFVTHIWVKKGYEIILTSEDGSISKRFSDHAEVDAKEFKNPKVEVTSFVQKTEEPHASEQETRDFTLKGKLKSKMNSTYCATAKKNSNDVIASECTPDYIEQEWKRDEDGRIVSVATDTCLMVKDDNTVTLEACDKVPRQTWFTDSLQRILAQNAPSLCLQTNGDTIVEGANLVMKDCKNDLIQQWVL